MVQWRTRHTPNTGDLGSILDWGTRLHMLQLEKAVHHKKRLALFPQILSPRPCPGHHPQNPQEKASLSRPASGDLLMIFGIPWLVSTPLQSSIFT